MGDVSAFKWVEGNPTAPNLSMLIILVSKRAVSHMLPGQLNWKHHTKRRAHATCRVLSADHSMRSTSLLFSVEGLRTSNQDALYCWMFIPQQNQLSQVMKLTLTDVQNVSLFLPDMESEDSNFWLSYSNYLAPNMLFAAGTFVSTGLILSRRCSSYSILSITKTSYLLNM